MSFRVRIAGEIEIACHDLIHKLVDLQIASSITREDATLWGEAAQSEAAIRLGWVNAVSTSRRLVPEIVSLRTTFLSSGIRRIVLAGMGGSSLAPEVMCRTFGAELTVLDSTHPGQVRAAMEPDLSDCVLVVSSKSGSTVETDSAMRVFHQRFIDEGISPTERIVVVTDPGSPLESHAQSQGYRVFRADPNVGGRYSALTAFGLVPSGLAGVDIEEILDEAEAIMLELALDSAENPALVLGAAIAARVPSVSKLGLVADGTHIQGLPDWIEQLLAESTGKLGTGVLPVVLDVVSTETLKPPRGLVVCRLVEDAHEKHLLAHDRHDDEILVSGTLGAQFLAWEYATAIAGFILGINPFDQPDVESAKVAARTLLEEQPAASPALFVDHGIEVRTRGQLLSSTETVHAAVSDLLNGIPTDGYLAIMAYADRAKYPELAGLRDIVAAHAKRPVTFGWGPRFLHSTGQFHKGGPALGSFLQIVQNPEKDLAIPGRPFSFGNLLIAQAEGDAAVLAGHGRPVLTLTVSNLDREMVRLFEVLN